MSSDPLTVEPASIEPAPDEPARSDWAAVRLTSASPDGLAEAARAAIAEARTRLAIVTGGGGEPLALLEEFDEAIATLADLADVADVIAATNPKPEVREAAEAAKQAVSAAHTDIELDRSLHDALVRIEAAADAASFDAPTRRYLTVTLRKFRRAGVERDEPTRQRVRALREALVEIGQDFTRTIRSDTRSMRLEPQALAGLPEDFLRAHPVGDDGLIEVTTKNLDYTPVMSYASDAAVRERMWRLYRQRGYPANGEVLRRLIETRHELATLLGYAHWADYASETKMIGSAGKIADFIERIAAAAEDRAARDYQALLKRKRLDDPNAELVLPWDAMYLADRIKAEQFAFDSQTMRPYFEYHQVKAGLMGLVERLFDIRFRPRPDVPGWHPDVECFDVLAGGATATGDDATGRGATGSGATGDDATGDGTTGNGALLGRIFLDMHPRPDKYGHAAMFTMITGKAGRRIPECALVCNLPRPGDEPALLLHSEVSTFFHEFGHMLHNIFAGHGRWAGVGGLYLEWDFVEAPSQLLEEWVLDAATLATFATHHETGEPIPAELVARLRAADEFGKGTYVRQQMFLAALSLELHRTDPAALDPVVVERAAHDRFSPYPYVDGTYLHLGFGHLDGYSALYCTYMWSMVIAKDLFTVFRREGLMSSAAAGRYRQAVLAPGGSAPAAELIERFLGRPYDFAAYQAWLNSD